jgi:hypothetical protein
LKFQELGCVHAIFRNEAGQSAMARERRSGFYLHGVGFHAKVAPMNSSSPEIMRDRQQLAQDLARVRRECLQASERRDFRAVARLTIEAARINKAIADSYVKEEALR